MAYLEELAQYKQNAVMKMLSNMDLCKAVYYNNQDFLSRANIEDVESLIYKNIFPYRFIPDIQEEMKTFITLTFGRFEGINNSFKSGKIYFNIFTHRDLFKTEYGLTRVDYILNRVDELFNYKSVMGIGKLEFGFMDEIIVNEKFIGASICYYIVDFNIDNYGS